MTGTTCPHPGAPQACPLCLLGEGFTEDGQAALDMLDHLIMDAGDYLTQPPLAHARECVLEREWRLAWLRLRDSSIGGQP